MTQYARPRSLELDDPVGEFSCGESALDTWLRRRAWSNELTKASRTFVTTPVGERVLAGYYALSAGSVDSAAAPGRVRRNMPNPIPVVILARLAVAVSHQGRGVGTSLLQDAIHRSVAAGQSIGLRAMVIHAASPRVGRFYENLGFALSPLGQLTYLATLADLMRTLDAAHEPEAGSA